MTPQLWIALVALVLLWDAVRRFAERGAWCTRDEYDELAEWIDGLADEAKTIEAARTAIANEAAVKLDALTNHMAEVQDRLDFEAKARVELANRIDAHGKTLTTYGLSAEAKAARAAAQALGSDRTRIVR